MKNINLNLAIRFFKKDRLFSIINLLGLSIGLACVYFIAIYVNDELSYDNYQQDNVFRIALERHFPNNQVSYAVTPLPLSYAVKHDFPEVVQASRALPIGIDYKIENEEKNISFREGNVLAADSGFLELMSIPILSGKKNALDQPYSVVITDKMAQKYFGSQQILGRKLLMNDTLEYTITAVVKDMSKVSHLEFDFILSWSTFPFDSQNTNYQWVSYSTYNYIKLRNDVTPEKFEKQLQLVVTKYIGPQIESILSKPYSEYEAAGNIHNFFLQPVKSIHLNSHLQFEIKPNGDGQYILLFSIVGAFILIIAAINFTNLSTARSIKRAKEVGIRKTLGSTRKALFVQFFTESSVLCLMSGILGALLFMVMLPYFNQIAGKDLSITQIDWVIYGPMFALIIALMSLLSGAYPAFFISSFNVVKILKGQVTQGKSKNLMRNLLVILQFSISIFLIIGTIIINRQVNYLMHKKLGFDKDQILTINDANLLGSSYLSFKNDLVQLPGISSVSSSFQVPGRQVGGTTFEAVGRPSTERFQTAILNADKNFITTYGLDIVEGRGFEQLRNDSLSVIINETAAKIVGWKNPIGQKLILAAGNEFEVIGVVNDFHFNSLHEKIRPMLLFGFDLERISNQQVYPPVISIQFDPNSNMTGNLNEISKIWDLRVSDEKLAYSFLDEEYDQLYRAEQRFGDIFLIFTVIAIFIALIGVIGLSSFFAVQKTREIGIRKVLGASMQNLIIIMSKDYVRMIIVSNLIAWPLAYIALNKWLENYPYEINITVDIFILAGLVSGALVLLATGYQSIKSALKNPVNAIRID
ncbi:MAG TPA: ABC transporter permease [Fulvivirga sp.]|nr:ABC transporter permease [Fulvivirga sp.]